MNPLVYWLFYYVYEHTYRLNCDYKVNFSSIKLHISLKTPSLFVLLSIKLYSRYVVPRVLFIAETLHSVPCTARLSQAMNAAIPVKCSVKELELFCAVLVLAFHFRWSNVTLPYNCNLINIKLKIQNNICINAAQCSPVVDLLFSNHMNDSLMMPSPSKNENKYRPKRL